MFYSSSNNETTNHNTTQQYDSHRSGVVVIGQYTQPYAHPSLLDGTGPPLCHSERCNKLVCSDRLVNLALCIPTSARWDRTTTEPLRGANNQTIQGGLCLLHANLSTLHAMTSCVGGKRNPKAYLVRHQPIQLSVHAGPVACCTLRASFTTRTSSTTKPH